MDTLHLVFYELVHGFENLAETYRLFVDNEYRTDETILNGFANCSFRKKGCDLWVANCECSTLKVGVLGIFSWFGSVMKSIDKPGCSMLKRRTRLMSLNKAAQSFKAFFRAALSWRSWTLDLRLTLIRDK